MAIHILTHQPSVTGPLSRQGFQQKLDEYGLLITDLQANPLEHIWSSGFRKHDRQTVKYHENTGCVFRFDDHADDFNNYLALKEGPVWNRFDRPEFFASMRRTLGDALKFAIVTYEEKVIAGSMFLCDRATSAAHLLSMRYSTVNNMHSPVTYMNWMTAKWAAEQNLRFVDFGPWGTEHINDPSHFAFKLMRRFEADFLPRYVFTIRPTGLAYSFARGIGKLVRTLRPE